MRVLVIGGTRFIGPAVVRNMIALGHAVTVFHRGNHTQNLLPGVDQIIASSEPGDPTDKYNLRASADAFRRLRPDVVVHMTAFVRQDAEVFMDVFAGVAERVVVSSSLDVYLAFGRVNGTEPGPPQPTPLCEDSELRHAPSIHGDKSEKRDVERVVLGDGRLPGTILRFPAVYGEGDYQYRFYPWTKRIVDKRAIFVLGQTEAKFRFTHGYVDDVGLATALAVRSPQATGRIYNVGERQAPTVRQRLEALCEAVGHKCRIIEAPDERIPDFDATPRPGHDLWADTSRIRAELGYAERTNYFASLRNTFQWQRNHPHPSAGTENPKSYDYAAEDTLAAEVDM